jgi:transcriptional regulator with XRE-family HTH domain
MIHLKIARIRQGLSQRDVARRIGISACALSLIESGQRGMKPVVAKKLAGVLGMSIEEVLFPEDKAA